MSFELVEQGLDALLAELSEEADSLAGSHTGWVWEQGKDIKGWEDRSRLAFTSKRTGDSIVLYWHQVRWMGTAANKTRRSVLTWIRKPKDSNSYTMEKLLSYAKDWEVQKVKETEKQAALLRRKLKAYQRLAFAFRVAKTEYEVAKLSEE